jgi:hypothetical protein
MSYYNGSQTTKICKQAAAVKTSNITFTIPEKIEIIRKPGNVTCQTVIMAAYKLGLLTIYNIKKQREKPIRKTLGHYR